MADQFPSEIIYDILSKMPIKSLARFRCVCKLWLKYINDPYLETIHVKEEASTLIMFQRFEPRHRHPNHLCKISFLRLIQGSLIAKQEPVMEMSYEASFFFTRQNLVIGSCYGLALVFYNDDWLNGIFFAVFNPLTKQYYHLPPAKTERNRLVLPAAGIGFDESTDTFKTVLCVILKPHDSSNRINVKQQIRTMVHDSGKRLWREIAQQPDYPISGEGVLVHGRLYWLASLYANFWPPPSYVGRKIVWFDVKLEEFGLLDPPKENYLRKNYCLRGTFRKEDHVVDLNGEVGYALFNYCFFELWILKHEGWVLHCCFETLDFKQYLKHEVLVVGFFNKKGDILLACFGGRSLVVYTLDTGDLRPVDRGDLVPPEYPRLAHPADIRMYQSSLYTIRGINTSAYSF